MSPIKTPKVPFYVNLEYERQMNRLAQNENPYGPSPLALKAVLDNIDKISHYPDAILVELKEKIAKKFGITREEVIVSNGSGAIINYLMRKVVGENGNIVLPELTFVAYKLSATIYKKDFRLAPMQDYAISLHNIEKCCDENTKLIFLPNPNNPTGTIFNHDEIASFLERIPSTTLVVLDEAYKEYVDNKNYPDSGLLRAKHPNLIIFRSFSKIYGLAGLRVGYGIARKEIITELEGGRIPFTVGTLSNIAALAALDDDDYLNLSKERNSKARELLFNGLTRLGYKVIPSEANFLYVSFCTPEDRDKMHDRLMLNKMVVRKMDAFGDGCALRISVGTLEHIERIIACLR